MAGHVVRSWRTLAPISALVLALSLTVTTSALAAEFGDTPSNTGIIPNSAAPPPDGERSARETGKQKSGASLVVRVKRPKKAGKPLVRVAGPNGFSVRLSKSRTLRGLPFGVYRVKAKSTQSKKFKATATVSTRKVRLTKKKSNRKVKVNYGTIVSRQLETLPPSKVQKFTAPTDNKNGTGTVISPVAFDRGAIIASDVSRAAPAGMLVKVVKKSRAKGKYVYAVRQATLTEAIPRGDFNVSFKTDLEAPSRVAADRRSGNRLPTRLPSVAKRQPASCSSSGSAGVEISASGGITTQLKANWDFADSSVDMTATAFASAQARAWLEASGQCTLPKQLFYERKFSPITVTVGPIPIVIVPNLEMFTGGSFSAKGSAEVKGSVGVEAVLKASANRKGLRTSFTGPTVTKQASFDVGAQASADIYAQAVVTGELYGIAGPHASMKISVLANANPATNPWWRVDLNATAGIGVKLEKCKKVFFKTICLKIDKSKDDLFSKTFPIVNAGGPFSPDPTPTPTPPPPPAPGIPTDLDGGGVIISPPETGGQEGAGRIASPTGDGDAWVLTTGNLGEVNGDSGNQASTDRGDPGNDTLSNLSGYSTYDATFLRTTITPQGNRLQIRYLFATEEYPEFVNSSFNDVMGIFVDGKNCANVPGTSTPVSVNTINSELNTQYFVDNTDGHLATKMNGLTTPLACVATVTPGKPVEVLIGVADSSDGILDSAVALIDGGISSYNQ